MSISAIRLSGWAVAGLFAAVVMLSGCASGSDLIATGRIAVEPHINKTLRKPPEVYEDKGDLVVSGRLERGLPRDTGGHVDVTVIGPNGTVVYGAQVKYRADTVSAAGTPAPRHGSFRRAHSRYGSYGVYAVRFAGLPPDGSVVKIRHDPESHSQQP